MKNFFSKLLSSNGSISSKRFAALLVLVNIIVFTWLATVNTDYKTPEYMYESLVLFCAGSLGITGFETIFGKKKNDDSSSQNTQKDQTTPNNGDDSNSNPC
jgi:hypothetical protein